MNPATEPRRGLAPFSLRDAPAFIERQFPGMLRDLIDYAASVANTPP